LFYVYPLKFLFTAVFNQESFEPRQGRMLFTIFGLGWAAVFLVFALLYRHAWAHRDTLELSPIERLRTRRGLFDHIVMVIIGVASVLLVWALPAAWVGVAGYWYFSVGIYFTIAGRVHGRRERALQQPAA
jgi:hypothetical protein